MFTVKFEGLCGFANRENQCDVYFPSAHKHAEHTAHTMAHGGEMHEASPHGDEGHRHHAILAARSLDFLWPTAATEKDTLLPDELISVGSDLIALWHLTAPLTAVALGGKAPVWTASRASLIDLAQAHPHATTRSIKAAGGAVLTLVGGFLCANSIRPEPMSLFRLDKDGHRVPVRDGIFGETVEWSSVGVDVVFSAGNKTIRFTRNATVTLTNAAPDIDPITHDHFGGYYSVIDLPRGDSRLHLDFGGRHAGEPGNCSPSIILPI